MSILVLQFLFFISLSSWCLVIDMWFFQPVQWVCLQFVIVVLPDYTHLLFLKGTATLKANQSEI